MTSRTTHGVLMSGVRYGIAALVSCALVAPASAQTTQPQSDQKKQPVTATMGSAMIVDSEDIARNPAKYYGKKVMIQPDDVDRIISPHVFLLDEDAAFAGPDVLVLVPSPAGQLSQGDDIMVTGTVRPYVVADIERDYDWFDADGIEIDFKDRPVIVATSVKASDGRELAGVIAQVPAAQVAGGAQAGVVEPGELAENPEQYMGKRVTVRAEVEEVYNPQLFTLDEDRMFVGPDVIVYARDGRTTLTEEADDEDLVVTVTGEVRKFIDSELFATATWFDPWFRDLDETGRGLVRSRPVIIADSITGAGGAELYTANTARTGAETAVGTSGAESSKASSTSSTSVRFTAGNSVAVNGTIRSMATDRAFWLMVDGRSEPIMVIVDAAKLSAMTGGQKPQVNQQVAISGTVKELPGTGSAVTVTDWGLKPEDANRLKQQRIYIYADSINPKQ